MKLSILFVLATCFFFSFAPAKNHTAVSRADMTKVKPFTEGVLYTRVSFPGNFMNEPLMQIDFEKGNLPEQLKELQQATSSKKYAEKTAALLKNMTADERASMGTMLMAAMMSPLYAKIYLTEGKVLAKANALNYSLESFMNTNSGRGKLVAIANDRSKEAAIEFSAANMRNVWGKEEIDAEKYEMKPLPEKETVAGVLCNKAVYTYKNLEASSKSGLSRCAYKLIVWYSPSITQDINFLHPFYFQLDKGILKIEVHYDKSRKNKMLYEVTRMVPKAVTENDFAISNVTPVIDWDTNQAQASMNMLSVMMSNAGNQSE